MLTTDAGPDNSRFVLSSCQRGQLERLRGNPKIQTGETHEDLNLRPDREKTLPPGVNPAQRESSPPLPQSLILLTCDLLIWP